MLKHTPLRVEKEHAAAAAVGSLFHVEAQPLQDLRQRTAGRDQLQQSLFARQQRFGASRVLDIGALQDKFDCTCGLLNLMRTAST